MIVDSLRYWVEEMHVDGFRFDLASILARDPSGHPLPNPPVLWDIESDPALAGTKLIAEAWDAAGLYQVGSFVGDAWKEWNGRFRDDVRDFFRGEPRVGAARGGPAGRQPRDLRPQGTRGRAERQLRDLPRRLHAQRPRLLQRKHNEANGEDNRDGADDNRSWNCGVEGRPTTRTVESLRNRQVKNFLTVTLMSLGVPMILMGDEVRRTQRGNNNAYCQDDQSTWFDWTLLEKHADVHRFVSLLTARRSLRDVEHERQRVSLNTLPAGGEQGLARREAAPAGLGRLFAQHRPGRGASQGGAALPPHAERLLGAARVRAADVGEEGAWRRWIDTALDSPHDIVPWQEAPAVPGRLRIASRPARS